jgi:hypothetical protein
MVFTDSIISRRRSHLPGSFKSQRNKEIPGSRGAGADKARPSSGNSQVVYKQEPLLEQPPAEDDVHGLLEVLRAVNERRLSYPDAEQELTADSRIFQC